MSITVDSGRQDLLVADVDFTYADFTSGSPAAAIEVPAGAVVVGGFIVIDTAFDSATSDTIIVGDGGDDNRYANAVNGASAALTALTITGYEYTETDNIDIQWTGVGAAPSAGAGRLVVHYYVDGRAAQNQG